MMKLLPITAWMLMTILLTKMAQGVTINVTIFGDLDRGTYIPIVIDQKTGKKYMLKSIAQGEKESVWKLTSKNLGNSCVLTINDVSLSISSSCVYAEKIIQTTKDFDLKIDLRGKPLKIVMDVDKESRATEYFDGPSKAVVGRLRRIDQLGLVSRWVFLKKNDEGHYVAEMANLQYGDYLFDLFSNYGKVANGDTVLGYAVLTKRIKIDADSLSFNF
jgi:hypothetical protein